MESKEAKDARDVSDSKEEMKIPPPRKGRRERQDNETNNLVTESTNNHSGTESFNPASKPRRKPGAEGNTNNTQDSNNNWMEMTVDSNKNKQQVKDQKTEDELTAAK